MDFRSAGFVAAPAAVASPSAFCGAAVCGTSANGAVVAPTSAPARIHMRSDVKLQKKVDKVAAVKERLAGAETVFQVALPGITVSQISALKGELPEGSTCATVKNTLMRRAIVDSDWSCVNELCVGSTVWFFVKDDLKGTVEAYKKWAKKNKREDILGGAMDSIAYDATQMKAIAALPSKKEMIEKIAVLLKTVPTKLGRSVKAVPTQLGRAINLAVNNPDDAETA
eukprot:Plantae.Rhodophyta-Palmaria_palmata.ctg24633.p1 GENE.Plantae.Rhodophyta-Palmaria_palmata.ctg24633~~Plantae.Rhodophyta-Palmaria_palmata.ctg24633.p1  ORF type:complete len:226 (-),score=50.45 Plantae.Rhodophyta-Palmaria_palmata.ctg24633:64-741(-)